MSKRYSIFVGIMLLFVLLTPSAHAQSPQIATGLSYLTSSQNPDGSWDTTVSLAETTASSISALETLKLLNQTAGSSYATGISWLQAQSPQDVEYIAERIRALNLTDASPLFPARDTLGGAWGGYAGYETNNLDTALALQALKSANYPNLSIINPALAYLTNSQNTDGGWGFYKGDNSNVYMTAVVSATLQQFPQMTTIATTITKATAYLIAHQNADGGFGSSPSTVYETALAYVALAAVSSDATVLGNAVNYLTTTQSANGSWNDDPYSTALAIKALYLSENRPSPPPPPPPGGRITGTVIDASTYQRLSGVAVVLESDPLFNATTDSSGNFTLADVPAGAQRVSFSLSGYAAYTATANVAVGSTVTLGNVPLVSAYSTGTIVGTVTDPGGNPLADVAVTVTGAWNGAITSGADGSFAFTYVTPGNVTIVATKSGYQPLTGTGTVYARTTISFFPRLSTTPPQATTGTLVGRVVEDQSGLPLDHLPEEQGVRVTLSGGIWAAPDPDHGGNFSIQDIPPNTYQVTVGMGGFTSQTFRVVIMPGVTTDLGTVRLAMTISKMTMTGKVTDASTGEPVPGAEVIILGHNLTGRSDFAGTYAITDIDYPGEYTVKVSATGYIGKTYTMRSAPWAQTMDIALVPMATKGSVSGTVVDASSNQPLAGASLTLVGDPSVSTVTDGTGTFTLNAVPKGARQINIALNGYTSRMLTTAIIPGIVNNVGSIPLSTSPVAASIRGTVRDASTNGPFTGVEIRAVETEVGVQQTVTAADGSYLLENVNAGLVTVAATAVTKPGYYPASFTGILEPGGIIVFSPVLSMVPPDTFDVAVQTDKTAYMKGDTVALSFSLRNKESIDYSASLHLRVTDPAGASVYDTSVDVNIAAFGSIVRDFPFVLQNIALGGEYTVKADLYDEIGKILGTARKSFGVATSQISVTPTLPAMFVAGSNALSFNLVNTGHLPVSDGALSVTLKDPDGQVVSTASQAFSLGLDETKTLTCTVTIPTLKFGVYTLFYKQSDETKAGQTTDIALPNTVTIAALFDNGSHRIRETATLMVTVTNTGRFNLDSAAVTAAVPDAAYTETKTLSPAPAVGDTTGSTLMYRFVIPETVTAGQHGAKVTVTLPSGSEMAQVTRLAIPDASLTLAPLKSNFTAGEVIQPVLTNSGGVDAPVQYKLSLFDARAALIAEKTGAETALAGSSPALGLAIPDGAVDGIYNLMVSYQDDKTGKSEIIPNAITITGVKGSLQVRTDKETYLLTENITGLSTTTNSGTVPMQNGNLHLQVTTAGGTQIQKTWTSQYDFQQGVRDGVDTYGVNDWIIPDEYFDGPVDASKWSGSSGGNFCVQSGQLYVDKASNCSGVRSMWQLEGDFDIQVDFNSNTSTYNQGAHFSVYNNSFLAVSMNESMSGYSGLVRIGGWETWVPSGSYSQSGRLRITRAANTVTTYYWSGSNWTQLASATAPELAGPCYANLTVYTWAGYGTNAAAKLDNFKVNSGRIKTENQTVDSVRLLPLNDNFDDGVLNRDRWYLWGKNIVQESNGTFQFYSDDKSQWHGLALNYLLSGDFEVTSRYRNYSSSGNQGSYHLLAGEREENVQFYIIRAWDQRVVGQSHFYNTDAHYSGPSISYSSSTGSFRLRREGTTGFTDYWDQSWKNIFSESRMSSKPAYIYLYTLSSVYKPLVRAEVDSFSTNKGTYASSGTIKNIYDSGKPSSEWKTISYSASVPVGTSIKFRTHTAETADGLSTAPWSDYIIASGSAISSPPGRWIEIEATLATTVTNVTPVLHDVTVTYGNDPGEILWQADLPVNLAQSTLSEMNNTIGIVGITGKLYLQGTLTSATGQTVATAEYPFYVEQGNFQLLLASDKKIYRPGETVTISGEVKNLASVAAAGLVLQIKDAGSGGGILYTATFDLPANSGHPFSFTTTGGNDGIYGLSGTVSQNGTTLAEIADQYETATPVVAATLTVPDTAGNAPFNVTVSLNNAGKVTATTSVRFTDDGGEIDSQEITIPAGETRMLQYTRQITGTTIYTAVLNGDLNQTLTKTVAYVALSSASNIGGKIVTDKASYNPNEAVTLTSAVSASSTRENLSVWVTVTNSQGEAVYSATAAIPMLLPGQTITINKYWNTGTNQAGTFLVTLHILDAASTVIAKSTCNLVISSTTNPAALLKGQISLDKQNILTGEPVTVSYSVTNAGNVDLSNVVLSVQTVHMSEQTVYNIIADQAILAMGATYTNSGRIDTQGYSAKDYLVVLRASIDGVEETLAGTYFRVEGAPSAPALSGPANGADVETFTPKLSVSNASDPNDDRLTYEFEIYAESGLTNLVTSGTVSETPGSTAWTVTAPLTENQTYYWRARAYDGRLSGPWMAPASSRVNTVNDLPSAPTISSPADRTDVAVLTPMLTINNSTDPDSTSLTYNFDIALDPEFTQVVASAKGVTSGQGTTSWTVPVSLQENGLYYWRAQADDWLMEGPWTTARFFVNTTNDAPSAPVVTAPANGSTVPALAADIVVTNSSDPDSSQLSYYFEADTVPTFDSTNLIRSGGVAEGEGTTAWHVEGLQDNTRYHVRVKASDGAAESPWSAVTDFFANTVNDPPTTPILANPSNGAGVNVFAPTLSVHNATDQDKDLLTYEFEVYADAAMMNLIAHAENINETAQVTEWEMPVVLTENQTYYWRARAYDGSLHSDWMPVASFMVNTANDAPDTPKLSSPIEGSSVATLTPTLAVVNAVDPDSDNQTYEFEIYSGGSLVTATTGVPEESSGITAWTPDTALTDNTVHQWRARAYDGDRYGPWMNMATFTVHIPRTSINATIDFDPDTLNRTSKGTWVVLYIELPAGYNPSDIDISSIRLEGTIPAETWPYAIGDHDKDGIPDLMVKFRRGDVINLLRDGESVPVHVTGKAGSMQFEGVDVIRVIQ